MVRFDGFWTLYLITAALIDVAAGCYLAFHLLRSRHHPSVKP